MKPLALPVLCLLATAAAAAEATHPFSVHDMVAMQRISDPRVSPDGALVAFTVRDTDLAANRGRSHVWLAAVDGSWARRLTQGEANDSQPRWSQDGGRLYFLSTRGGSQQVFRLPLTGGEAEPVTHLPLDVDALEVALDGQTLVFAMRVFPGTTPDETARRQEERRARKASGVVYERLFVRHHLFAYRLADGQALDLMKVMDADCPSRPFGGSEEFALSPERGSLVFSAKDVGREEAWSTNFDLFVVPLDGSGAPRKITTNPAWDTQPRFSPDGRTLAYLAMSRPGYESDRFDIVLRGWPNGPERKLTLRTGDGPRDDRSPASLRFSADGGTLYATADDLGEHPLFALDLASGSARRLVGGGTVSAAEVAGTRILFGRHSYLGPTELFTIAAAGGDERRVTHVNDARVAAIRFGAPEPFHFAGALGETVHGWLIRPVDFDPGRKYPVAFLIHGGPQGSFANDFHYRWNPQAYAGAGYAAVMVDFHGSTGYGQAFTDAIHDDWGGKPYQDLMKGLDHVLAQYPFLDGSRVCALGASFGGYMINWIAGQTGRFRCLVVHDGNLDERSAYFATEELWFPEWDHAGRPWDAPANYTKQNPVEHVRNWAKFKTPTLVVHGGRDFRVVATEGLSTFTALQRLGIPSKLLYFPDENHWVLKPQNSILWHETVLGWLDRWLKEKLASRASAAGPKRTTWRGRDRGLSRSTRTPAGR
jgi:dipeptidyl aminopeptidase/acylaminoacyl peptidase